MPPVGGRRHARRRGRSAIQRRPAGRRHFGELGHDGPGAGDSGLAPPQAFLADAEHPRKLAGGGAALRGVRHQRLPGGCRLQPCWPACRLPLVRCVDRRGQGRGVQQLGCFRQGLNRFAHPTGGQPCSPATAARGRPQALRPCLGMRPVQPPGPQQNVRMRAARWSPAPERCIRKLPFLRNALFAADQPTRLELNLGGCARPAGRKLLSTLTGTGSSTSPS